jgi:hypothetical protein
MNEGTARRRPGSRGATGYRLIVPDGWVRLNVRDRVDDIVAGVLSEVSFDQVPRDERPKRRAAIEGRLRLAIDNAKKVDAYALYLPLRGMHGLAIPASFIVAEATDFSGGGPESEVLEKLLSEPGATPVVLDGTDAVRTESETTGLDETLGTQIAARQIVYVVPVPGSAEWLLVVYDVMSDEGSSAEYEQFLSALIALFDGMMSTFRWTFDDE